MSLSIKRTTTALAIASLATLASLTACDDSESGASSASSFDTVDAEEYTDNGVARFRLTEPGTACEIVDPSRESQAMLNCTLPFKPEVTDVVTGQRTTSLTYMGRQGFLPSQTGKQISPDRQLPVLAAGEQLDVGPFSCRSEAVDGNDRLTCSISDQSFTYDNGKLESSAWKSPWTGAGDQCGDIEKGEFPKLPNTTVRVERGPVNCGEAMNSINRYLATPTDADHGNANLRKVNDWTCSMPTWGTSQENGLVLECYKGDLHVGIPKPDPKTCGPAERGRFSNLADTDVTVTDGDVDCAEAVDIFNAYLSSPKHPKNSGNVLNLDINGWKCGSGIMMGANDPDAPMFRCSSRDGETIIRGH